MGLGTPGKGVERLRARLERQERFNTPLPEASEDLLRRASALQSRTSERRLIGLRLIVIAFATAIFPIIDRSHVNPSLAYALLALGWLYALWLWWGRPSLVGIRYSFYLTALCDAALIFAWLFATGGVDSAFYILPLIAVGATALRHSLRHTAAATLAYALAYIALVTYMGQLDGHWSAVLVQVAYIVLAGGLGAIVSQDLLPQGAERARMRALLRTEEARLRLGALVESSDDAIVGLTRDGLITSWNNGAERMYGHAREEARGQPLSRLLHAEELQPFREVVQRIARGERIHHYESIHARKGGKRIHVSLSVSPVQDATGELTGLSVIARDVSSYHEARSHIVFQAALLSNLADAVIVTDEHLRVKVWNAAAQAIYGWAPAEAIGLHVSELLRAEPAAVDPDSAIRKLTEIGRFSGELTQRRKDGSIIFVETAALALRGKDGIVTGYVSVNRDISERKKLQESLDRQTSLYQTLLQVQSDLGDGVAILEEERIVYANDALARLYGYSVDELLRVTSFLDYIAPDERGRVTERLQLHSDSSAPLPALGETVVVRKDGKHIDIEYALKLVRTEGRIQGFCIIRDITERKQAEQSRLRLAQEKAGRAAAEEGQRQASLLAEASTILAASLDYEKTLPSVAGAAVAGFSDWCMVELAETDGAETREIAAAHRDPSKMEALKRLRSDFPPSRLPFGVSQVVETGTSEFFPEITGELREKIARGPGHIELLQDLGFTSAMIVPITARGKTMGAIVFGRGQTIRDYGGADLAVAEDLGRRAGLAIDNARLYREAKEAIRARDEFLSIASHELRTPLSALTLQLGSVRRLLREQPESGRLSEKADKAGRQTERLQRLIDDLLDVSRLSAGRFKLEPEDLDLAEVAREVIERLADEAARMGCQVNLHSSGPAAGSWDRLRIDQVMTNLLANAVKYGQGKPIEVTVEADSRANRIVVQDHGIGIEAENVARIFGRFERAVSVRKFGGLGLGLYIARQIVEAHGGSIRVTSVMGEGSTFTVEFPRSVARPATPPAAPATKEQSLQ